MSNLLQVVRFQTKAMQKKGVMPLMMEFQVAPETAPYLVSATNSFLWVEKPHHGSVVKAAVRVCTPGEVFQEIVLEVARRGIVDEWGNVRPFTQQGLEAVQAHLESYGLTELDFLAPPEVQKKARPKWVKDLPLRPTSWVPEGWLVVVPKNREYVGLLGHLDASHIVSVVHNASRGIGLLRCDPESSPEKDIGFSAEGV